LFATRINHCAQDDSWIGFDLDKLAAFSKLVIPNRGEAKGEIRFLLAQSPETRQNPGHTIFPAAVRQQK
jgi:hypothetical protein